MTSLQEYVVIENCRVLKLGKGPYSTAELIGAGGSLIMARNADEAEEVYVVEHGGSINDLVSFIAWESKETDWGSPVGKEEW